MESLARNHIKNCYKTWSNVICNVPWLPISNNSDIWYQYCSDIFISIMNHGCLSRNVLGKLDTGMFPFETRLCNEFTWSMFWSLIPMKLGYAKSFRYRVKLNFLLSVVCRITIFLYSIPWRICSCWHQGMTYLRKDLIVFLLEFHEKNIVPLNIFVDCFSECIFTPNWSSLGLETSTLNVPCSWLHRTLI